ncbi:MAG: hypothetical protein R2876_02755 [Eubacteriales bacterium]
MSCNCSRYRSIEDIREIYKKDDSGPGNNFNNRVNNQCCNQGQTNDLRYKDRGTSFLNKDSRMDYR